MKRRHRPFQLTRLAIPATPLDPPPTPEELAWWEEAQRPVRRWIMSSTFLMFTVPLMIGHYLEQGGVHPLLSPKNIAFLFAETALSAFMGVYSWKTQRASRLRSALIAKRLREGLTMPDGDPASPNETAIRAEREAME